MRVIILLLLLIAGNFLNLIDRNVISLFLPVIREDIPMSATEAGLITGFAFAIIYSIVALPVARIADRRGPRSVIAGAMVVWSIATTLCGMVTNAMGLFGARMLVGAGEAGFAPVAHSALASMFSKERLGRAISGFMLGAGLGHILGFYISGRVADEIGWRPAFQIIGVAGMALGALIYLVWPLLAPRGAAAALPPEAGRNVGVIETFRILFRIPAFRPLLIAASLHAIATYGTQHWIPSYLKQAYQMDLKEVGFWMGLVYAVASITATFSMGFVVDLFRTHKLQRCMQLAAIATALTVPFYLYAFTMPGTLGRILFTPAFLMAAIYYVPTYTVLQKIVPQEIRASANAIVLTSFTVIGLGVGPTLTGLGTDLFEGMKVDNAMGLAAAAVGILDLVAAVFFVRAARRLRDHVE